MKTKLLLLTLLVLTILSTSCTKHTTKEVYEYQTETTTEVKKDSLYTHKPDSAVIETEVDLNIQPCPPCPEVDNINPPPVTRHPSPLPTATIVKVGVTPHPSPATINTDTLWIRGRFADSYAFIRNSKLVHGMIEGKQFDILLKDITTERDHYKEKYLLEKEKTVVEKSTWKKDLLIVLLTLALILLIAVKLISR
ncbi:MAG: hypothetical protein PHS05_10465 [Bacteroidales bacterium]|nr:hypothetical protein [Bacteroidales bacterium]